MSAEAIVMSPMVAKVAWKASSVWAGVSVTATDTAGLPATQVEAAAFAWLAWAHVHGLPGNLTAVTGAAGPRILGAHYPA